MSDNHIIPYALLNFRKSLIETKQDVLTVIFSFSTAMIEHFETNSWKYVYFWIIDIRNVLKRVPCAWFFYIDLQHFKTSTRNMHVVQSLAWTRFGLWSSGFLISAMCCGMHPFVFKFDTFGVRSGPVRSRWSLEATSWCLSHVNEWKRTYLLCVCVFVFHVILSISENHNLPFF